MKLIEMTKPFRTSFRMWMGTILLLIVRDAEDMKKILHADESFDKANEIFNRVFDFGSLKVTSSIYKIKRRAFITIFHPSQLRRFFPRIKNKANSFVERFDGRLDSMKTISFRPLALDFALDALMTAMFSKDDIPDDKRMELIAAIDKCDQLMPKTSL